ncbi:MAG: PD-(D/E)XK nuclease family protein [Phascolarctobacterium sp.]|nr:PD-(D/E)XK nuclease family protein [Candidatus Phascolarctobacterium equi]
MINYSEKRQEYIKELEALPYGEGVLVLPNAGLQREVKLHHMVKCIGLDTLATQVVNEFTGARFDLVDRKTQELIVARLLQEHKDELQYFDKLLDKEGLARELTTFFTELRRCNMVTAEELAGVFQNWQTEVQSGQSDVIAVPVAKNHDVVLLFSAYLDYLVKHDLYDLEGQYALAAALLHEGREEDKKFDNGRQYYLSDMPFLNQLQREFVAQLGRQALWQHDEVWDFKKELRIFADNHKQVVFRKFASHEDELIGALRQVKDLLAKGMAAEKIGIVVKNLRSFSGAERLCREYGVPMVLSNQSVLGLQPLCQQVLNSLTAQGTAKELADQAKELLQNACLETTLGEQYAQGLIDMTELQTVLQTKSAIGECLDKLVRSYRMCGLADQMLKVADFKQHLADLFRHIQITLSKGAEQGVVLTDLLGALGRSFEYVFVLGMNEGEFPEPLRENWIYSDSQRSFLKSIGFDLSTAREKYSQNDYYFLLLLQTVTGEVVFSWTETEELGTCGYVLVLLNLYQCPVEDWRSRLAKERKNQPMSQQEFVLANTDCGVDSKEYFDVDKARCAGEQNLLGVIGDWGQKSNPVYTATEIENFAKCPFAYMVDKVWGRGVYEDDEDDLMPLADGSLMHRTLEIYVKKYMQACLDVKERRVKRYQELGLDKEATYEKLKAEFLHAFNEAKKELQGLSDYQRQQLEKTKTTLLAWFETDFEMQWENNRYNFFKTERPFGPVKFWNGDVAFKGRIDRVDSIHEDGKLVGYKVVDYKRGSVPRPAADLQLRIYQLALEKVLTGVQDWSGLTREGEYSSIKGQNVVVRNLDEDFVKTLKTYTEQIAQGDFDVRKVRDCNPRYCAYATICRQGLLKGDDSDEE